MIALFSFPLAAVPLIHAIPAATSVYYGGAAILLLFYRHSDRRVWILKSLLLSGSLTVLLLLPFLSNLSNPVNPALLDMISKWQLKMGPDFGGGLLNNVWRTAIEIKYRLGDAYTFITLFCLLYSLLKREKRVLFYFFLFFGLTLLLILNSGYWVLPLSFLLYPERVIFFLVIPSATLMGLLLERVLFERRAENTGGGKLLLTAKIVIVLIIILSPFRFWSYYLRHGIHSNVEREEMDSFRWIRSETEPNALFHSSYPGPGIWIPAFSNRATVGAHLHFIHQRAFDNIEKESRPKYFYVLESDRNGKPENRKKWPEKGFQ